jgi:hypothetical protein
MPFPDTLFARLAERLPPYPGWLLPALAGIGFIAAAALVSFHHYWAGAGALLIGLAAAGLGQAPRVLLLGLLTLPFGFALADPSRALPAMFLMFAMAVLATIVRAYVSVVTFPIGVALLLACLFPYHFSLLSYLVGIACFVVVGQGVSKGHS